MLQRQLDIALSKHWFTVVMSSLMLPTVYTSPVQIFLLDSLVAAVIWEQVTLHSTMHRHGWMGAWGWVLHELRGLCRLCGPMPRRQCERSCYRRWGKWGHHDVTSVDTLELIIKLIDVHWFAGRPRCHITGRLKCRTTSSYIHGLIHPLVCSWTKNVGAFHLAWNKKFHIFVMDPSLVMELVSFLVCLCWQSVQASANFKVALTTI